MLSRPLLSFVASLLLCCFAAPLSAAPLAWESLGVVDGVWVERAEVPNSDIMAFRGGREVDLSLARLLNVFRSPKERRHWVSRYHSHTTIEKTQLAERYWIRFKLPPLISDRDYVLQSKAVFDQGKRTVNVTTRSVTDPAFPPSDCCVRAEVRRSSYRFEALSPTRTRVQVEVHTDPKGLLPSGVVNYIQRNWPSRTLNRLVARAREVEEVQPELQRWVDGLTF